jgi:tRNA pseudouridine55 synthase
MSLLEDYLAGRILLIDKDYEWTSFDVVNKIRWIITKNLGVKKIKVGHAGTLDPLATGLVIVCTGKATKTITDFLNLDKEYLFKMKLGETTPSYDLETEVQFVKDPSDIKMEHIETVIKKYIGNIMQVPPLFSAKYVCGTRAYEYARKGIKMEMDPVPVNISTLEIINYDSPFLSLRVVCSKGTYIRSIARDIGLDLACGAYLTDLRRTAIGDYSIDDAISINEFEKDFFKIETN